MPLPHSMSTSSRLGTGTAADEAHSSSPSWWIDSLLASTTKRSLVGPSFHFVVAAKLPDLRSFADHIADFGLLPEPTLHVAAVGLVALELLGGVGLALDLCGSLTLVAGLLLLFSAALAYGLYLGLDIGCGCCAFGNHEPHDETLTSALLRDLALLALCAYIYWHRHRNGILPRSFVGFARPTTV